MIHYNITIERINDANFAKQVDLSVCLDGNLVGYIYTISGLEGTEVTGWEPVETSLRPDDIMAIREAFSRDAQDHGHVVAGLNRIS